MHSSLMLNIPKPFLSTLLTYPCTPAQGVMLIILECNIASGDTSCLIIKGRERFQEFVANNRDRRRRCYTQ